jgi:peptidoglycan hydrolase-like protein with peptidoglycan-binding domain
MAAANTEFFAPAAEAQEPVLTGSANTLSKADIQLLQRRLKAAGFYFGPLDGTLGFRTKSALTRCKLGCATLNELSGTADKPVLEQVTEITSPDTSASAPTAAVKIGSGDPQIRRAQERLKAAGFDPGPIDGKLGPQTRSALEKYRSSYKLSRSGADGLVHY